MDENSIKNSADASMGTDSIHASSGIEVSSPNTDAVNDDNPKENTNNISSDSTASITNGKETPTVKRTKITKKKSIIIAIAFVAVIAIAFTFLHKSKFERVEDKVFDIVGMATTGKGYFIIDTDPDDWENMDSKVKAILLPDHQERALNAIRYANEALGFNGSVYNKMMETSALMGRQTQENSKYRVSWTYHPNDGLEVTYEKK